jgi:putative transposase
MSSNGQLAFITGENRMPRRARLTLPDVPMHVIQRGNNRQSCSDCLLYLEWLREYADATACRIHAYVLMGNHVHLLVSSATRYGVAALMKALGQRYTQYVNRVYKRSGTLWEGRYRSCLTQDEQYLLTCQRYIELNPVRACMVAHPWEYRWSSYRANALGEVNPLIDPHPLYLSLGREAPERQAAYRSLFRNELAPSEIDTIRRATTGNFALGDLRFGEQITDIVGQRAMPGKSGRPKKSLP